MPVAIVCSSRFHLPPSVQTARRRAERVSQRLDQAMKSRREVHVTQRKKDMSRLVEFVQNEVMFGLDTLHDVRASTADTVEVFDPEDEVL